MKNYYLRSYFLLLTLLFLFSSCEILLKENEDENTLPATGEYVVFAWNDLGMHCLNPTYDQAIFFPPYNTIWAQVVKRGNPPEIITSGITVEYALINNTDSFSKRDYGQFWDNAESLFGTTLEHNTGLNLVNPADHNGLSGIMVSNGDHFEVNGIPVVPVDDDGNWDPYQIAKITVRDDNDNILISTQATVPTSDEINCGKCHGADPFADILEKHDTMHGTSLQDQTPVLCSDCHVSPILGGTTSGTNYLSKVIHDSHSDRDAVCYDCHPGASTMCSRSVAHTDADGNCTSCHGSMTQVAVSIVNSGRIPWEDEPQCADCHEDIHEVDTGNTLYRNAIGHGGMYCASCHGSPHAMIPSEVASDNYQALQYQNASVTIGSCAACHSRSKGPNEDEFAEEHGGSNPEKQSACHVCHTAVPINKANWPHAFEWQNRS